MPDRRGLLVAAVIAFLATTVTAQSLRTINLTGFSFVDTVTGTNQTTIAFGDSVRFNRLNGTHTATSGFPGAGSGALFNFNLNATTTTGTWTPAAPGSYPYFCNFHSSLGMIGTIIVQPPPLYPGTGEDFSELSAVNGPGLPLTSPTTGGGQDVKFAIAGYTVTILARSQNGTFNFAPIVLAAQLFTTGQPAPVGTLPGLHLTTSGAFVLINGLDPGVLGAVQVVVPGGSSYGFLVPAGLAGSSVMIQSFAFATTAANGIFAISEGHEIQFF